MLQQLSWSSPDWIAGLPADVWVNSLGRLAIQSIEELSSSFYRKIPQHVQTQAHYLHLQLVCRMLRNILQQHPQLSQQLVLSQIFDSESLPSFKLWLGRHEKAVRNVGCNKRSFQEDALEHLSVFSPGLARIIIASCSPAAVKLLPSFRGMVVCEIQANAQLNINALQSLESLLFLNLTGGQFRAALPPNLTELKLRNTQVYAGISSSCVTSLKSLTVVDSYLRGLGPQGLIACARPNALRCEFGTIAATASPFDNSAFSTAQPVSLSSADNLSALAHVTELSCTFHYTYCGVPELDPLYALTSLETLRLQWTEAGNAQPLQVLCALTALSRLSHISFIASHTRMELDVDWGLMHVLQSLSVDCILYCNNQMLHLSTLSSLRRLDMAYCESGNEETSRVVNTLLCNAKAHHPTVEVSKA